MSIISYHVLESNAHVGSSAKMIDGLITKALAIETLCCSHQDISLGLLLILCPNHTFFRACMALSFLSFFGIH
jgi:hypothetical protein